jgi:hypothetical protein
MSRGRAGVADEMRAVAAVAQRFARLDALLDAGNLDVQFAFENRKTFDRAALVRVRLQNSAGIGGKIIALQPFDGLDPADDRQTAFAVVGDENRRVGSGGLLEEGRILRRLQDALDRNVERLSEAPNRGESRVGLVALDLADDRFRDARLLGQLGKRQIIGLAQALNGRAQLAGQRQRSRLQNLLLVAALDAHDAPSSPFLN